MQVNLYYTKDDRHKLHKTLTSIHNCVGSLREECSIINPIILLETAEATACRANYLEITDLDIQRYYFIKDWIMYRTGILEVHAELDPLMTFADEIAALEVTVERNEFDSDAYLVDENYKIDAYSNYVTIDFPNGFDANNDSYVLMTVGAGSTSST